jgi:hypothetical protein
MACGPTGPTSWWHPTSPNMRKKLLPPIRKNDAEPGSGWLDLHQAASVELTSEADGCPIEGALSHEGQPGWRAGMPGVQTIRLLLDEPQTIHRIRLVFKEEEIARTQEFVLRWLHTAQTRGRMSSANSGISVRRAASTNVRTTGLTFPPRPPLS